MTSRFFSATVAFVLKKAVYNCFSMKEKEIKMSVGTVKWFNTMKGFGFICPSDGSKDVFVHISAVQKAGIRGLQDGQCVEYDLLPGKDGRMSAENLKLMA